MQAAIALSLALLASAAEGRAFPSLKGGRSPSGVAENVTATAARAGASEAAMPEGTPEEADFGSAAVAADLAELMAMARNLSEGGNISEDGVNALLLMKGGWHQGGDKMWGSGIGVESITEGNAGYYDAGMSAARARCGDAGCALITNPPGHRTVANFHIHFVHFGGYGADLKRRLEGEVCGRSGWRGGSLPCGGRAALFPGFPGVFSCAMAGGGLHHASVIAWPASCGGSGTIVELAYDCSIEHQIRGDYDPNHR